MKLEKIAQLLDIVTNNSTNSSKAHVSSSVQPGEALSYNLVASKYGFTITTYFRQMI